ncbi:MAG: hypothetical protein ACR2LL_12230 [Nitrosopumilus sp.]
MTYPEKSRSRAWFLLPILFGIIGGVAAFLFLRKDDAYKAKICLCIGLIMMVTGIALNIWIYESISGFDSGFNVNI